MSLEIAIKKHFPSFDLDVEFEAGSETFGLLGSSGCGKSLTMRCIAGIETPDEGRIVVNGTTFFDSEQKINLTPQQRKTALLFQNYMLFPNMTVEANVAAGIGKDVSAQERRRIVDGELTRFDVASYRKRYPNQLSGGQQQRVALARMLAARPRILMLDEPFSALDSHLKGMLEQNLISLFSAFEGRILYVSHDIDEALRFCDRIAVMDKGRIVGIKQGRELVDKPQTIVSVKLSGCKNVTEARYVDGRTVFCPRWGVSFTCEQGVREDIVALGVRAFYLKQVDKAGPGVFKMHVDRVSDSRFDRTVLLSFVDRLPDEKDCNESGQGEIHYLHQRVIWRIDLLQEQQFALPQLNDEIFIFFDTNKFYLVSE